MLLARAGHDVLLVDRGTVGSEIPHGHFIHRHGPRRLADWGLLESLLATNCPPSRTIAMDLGDGWLTSSELVADGVPIGIGPRRSRLDGMLVDAAAAAGAEVREHFVVDDLIERDGRVAGVRGRRLPSPAARSEHARVVIGADGRGSGVARRVGARVKLLEPTVSCWYFSYWDGVPSTGLEMALAEGIVVFAFPTNDDLLAVFVGWPIDQLPVVRADIEGHLLDALEIAPGLGERVRAGTRAERYYGASHLPNHLREASGPGWALVGDAGCHKDPFRALGVCDALRDAELLAGALSAGLADDGPDRRRAGRVRDTARRSHAGRLRTRTWPPPARARPGPDPRAARARAGRSGRDRPLLPCRGGPPR